MNALNTGVDTRYSLSHRSVSSLPDFTKSSERRTLKDGRLTVVATEADFATAASLFVDLHTTGGSLTSKFDRNEQLSLSLASHFRAEQFCLADLQRRTGWYYQKARRLMLGYDSRGSHYPGLLDKSPALSLVDQTVSETDGEGRDVKRRSLVFIFNEEAYRKAQFAGQVWLEEDTSFSSFSKPDPAERPAERTVQLQSSSRSGKEYVSEEIGSSSFSRLDCTGGMGRPETPTPLSVPLLLNDLRGKTTNRCPTANRVPMRRKKFFQQSMHLLKLLNDLRSIRTRSCRPMDRNGRRAPSAARSRPTTGRSGSTG